MPRPLAIDLFCGLGGWAEGFLAEGYDVIGFDTERHDYGTGGYPGQLVGDALKGGGDWFGAGKNCSLQRKASSRSDSRKAASAAIAKIPFPLANHIARVFYPRT